MVEAARKYDRIVQSGIQNRQHPYNIKAKEYIDSGRDTTGTTTSYESSTRSHNRIFKLGQYATPTDPRLDLWNRPAPEGPYDHTMHSHWHAFWRYSGGEVTNDGVHQLDLARSVTYLDFPKTIYAQGRAYREPGASEAPDTVITTFEFDKATLVYEQTLYAPYMIKSDMEKCRHTAISSLTLRPQNGERIEIFGSKAMMILGRHGCGWQVFGRQKNRQPVVLDQMHGRFPDRWHHENFVNCMRSRSVPNADIEEGHRHAPALSLCKHQL